MAQVCEREGEHVNVLGVVASTLEVSAAQEDPRHLLVLLDDSGDPSPL